MTDFITLMQPTDGRSGAKEVTPQGVHVPPVATWYRAGHVPVDSLERLAMILDKAAVRGSWFAVRGKAVGDMSNMRRLHDADKHGDQVTLVEHAHKWLLVDVDSWRPEVTDFPTRLVDYADQARAALGFGEAACWYQATSSAGIKPGVRLRLGFWLDREIDNDYIKQWLAGKPVDHSIYTPSQPHFLATPTFRGVLDPFAARPRSGVLSGAPHVVTPSRFESSGDADLASAARAIRRAPEGERRNTLNTHAFRLAASTALPLERIEEALLPAAYATGLPGHEALATLRTALRDGRAKYERDRKGWKNLLWRTDDGGAQKTQANTTLYLEHHEAFAGKLAYDERAHRPLWVSPAPWGGAAPRFADETDTTHAVEWFQHAARMDVKPQWVRDGLVKAAMRKGFDPIQDYLSKLSQWDATPRAETFFIRHLGVPDTPLTRAQTRIWLIQAVRRAFATIDKPVQADYMIVLSGPPGLRKSSLLRSLCPDPRFFRDHLPPLSSADARIAAANSWLVELSELTVHKSEQAQFKAFITCQVDVFRRPYGRDEVTAPRRCVMAPTTNEGEFLVDPTGNRRFMPFVCTRRADVDEVIAERDQVWAEALVWAHAGEQAYLTGALDEEATRVQDEHTEENPAEDQLRRVLSRPLTLFEGTDWYPGQLDDKRRLMWITVPQAQSMVRAKTLAQARYALYALGWTRVMDGRAKKFVPPVGWYQQQERAHDQN